MDGGIVIDEKRTRLRYAGISQADTRFRHRLDELPSAPSRILHDRSFVGARGNIDHLAVTPNGVYVIDAEKYAGRPRLAVEGGLLRPRVEKLMVGSRNCTELVDGVLEQVKVVRGVVGESVPVHGVLCFVGGDWAMFGGAFTTRTVSVLWPTKLYPQLRAPGPVDLAAIEELHRTLAVELPAA